MWLQLVDSVFQVWHYETEVAHVLTTQSRSACLQLPWHRPDCDGLAGHGSLALWTCSRFAATCRSKENYEKHTHHHIDIPGRSCQRSQWSHLHSAVVYHNWAGHWRHLEPWTSSCAAGFPAWGRFPAACHLHLRVQVQERSASPKECERREGRFSPLPNESLRSTASLEEESNPPFSWLRPFPWHQATPHGPGSKRKRSGGRGTWPLAATLCLCKRRS